jgi:hypothetical protein
MQDLEVEIGLHHLVSAIGTDTGGQVGDAHTGQCRISERR